jgi:hypothetical protein
LLLDAKVAANRSPFLRKDIVQLLVVHRPDGLPKKDPERNQRQRKERKIRKS